MIDLDKAELKTIDLSSFVGSEIDMVFTGIEDEAVGKLIYITDGDTYMCDRYPRSFSRCQPRFGHWNVITEEHLVPEGAIVDVQEYSAYHQKIMEAVRNGPCRVASEAIAIRYHKETQPGYKWG